ncbi:sensor histidine kinase [Amycolatopsis pittospori]|uniref:sensor histidine kinase n=1 Tax=Amycolatopsis pittospori TaxID=2749434 RepID=UPI0015F01075|nr:nitrate- and nitrite sensing domain-containing protein [Amycolatopsis pittospori]
MARRDKRPRGGDAAERHPRVGGRWRLRNWHLRTKLFVVLLIPALAVVALVGLRVNSDLRDARQLAEFATRGRVDSTVAEAVHQLQRERDLTVRFVAGDRKADVSELTEQRKRVDEAIGTFDRTLGESKSRLGDKAATSLQMTSDRLRVLTGLRFSAEHSAFPADAVLRSYSELISGLLDISDATAADVSDPDLGKLRLAGNALARIKDQMSVKRAIMAAALAQGGLNRDRTRALLGAEAELAAARNDYRTFATPEQQRMYDDTVIGLIVDIGNDMVESALIRAENDQGLGGLDPNQWDTAATYTVNLAHQVQQAVLVQLQERTDTLAAQARTSAIWDGGIVLAVLVVAGVLSVIIARSLLRPLRILRRSALQVAEHQLPAAVQGLLSDPEPQPENLRRRLAVAPVPVFSREELGQVARAFDAVHGEAVRLAGEQAMLRENINAMFVNLSQRSQDLVERQLSVLDRMEADEQDPDTLAGLFELDHLATRMRRNSENLLVLSGTDVVREDSGAVVADEIIGAALSEVEHYQRIELGAAPQIAVRGEAVNDLVHVVSELLENATRYSDQSTMVQVEGRVTERGEWQIDITDHGAGMPQAEIDRTNTRLANPPDVDVEVSRRMGLFVVATLAVRHRIDVRLRSADGGGITAVVVVPSGLIVDAPQPAPIPEPAPVVVAPEPEPEPPLEVPPLPEPEESGEESRFAPVLDPTPPRRAPVVERETQPEWPSTDDDAGNHLDLDSPTERMPKYQSVLSQWFDHGGPREGPSPAEPGPPSVPSFEPVKPPEETTGTTETTGTAETEAWPEDPDEPTEPTLKPVAAQEKAPAPEPRPAPEPEPTWPTPGELEQEDGQEDTWPVLPAAVPEARSQDDRPEMPRGERPILSLSPEAVRERMTSLQGGFRRGRHARGDDNPSA